MPLWSCDFDQQPQRLAGIVAAGSSGGPTWTDAELGAVLRHQLQTPIETELMALGAAAAARFNALCGANENATTTMSSVFAESDPPLALLEIIKEFSKSLLEHPESALPREVAGVLYWTAIAAGLVLKKTKITKLQDKNLSEGLNWAASRPWLELRIRTLLQDAMHQVQTTLSHG